MSFHRFQTVSRCFGKLFGMLLGIMGQLFSDFLIITVAYTLSQWFQPLQENRRHLQDLYLQSIHLLLQSGINTVSRCWLSGDRIDDTWWLLWVTRAWCVFFLSCLFKKAPRTLWCNKSTRLPLKSALCGHGCRQQIKYTTTFRHQRHLHNWWSPRNTDCVPSGLLLTATQLSAWVWVERWMVGSRLPSRSLNVEYFFLPAMRAGAVAVGSANATGAMPAAPTAPHEVHPHNRSTINMRLGGEVKGHLQASGFIFDCWILFFHALREGQVERDSENAAVTVPAVPRRSHRGGFQKRRAVRHDVRHFLGKAIL